MPGKSPTQRDNLRKYKYHFFVHTPNPHDFYKCYICGKPRNYRLHIPYTGPPAIFRS